MPMKIGYYLITDPIKDYDNIILITNKGVDDPIYDFEYNKGKYPTRDELFKSINSNDTLVIYELSHIASTLKQLFKLKDLLVSKSITLISIKENINTGKTDLDQEYILQLITEFDFNVRSEKTIIGLGNARRYGIKGGRRKGLSPSSLKKAEQVAKLWQSNPDINYVVKMSGVPRSTTYRYLKKMGINVK